MKNNFKLTILVLIVFTVQGVFSDEHIVRLPRQVLKDVQLASELQDVKTVLPPLITKV